MSKVFVGLSGGVDSAVAAALLKAQGHDVTGAFIKIWRPEFIECTWREDRLDAMRVCAALDIPYREIDLSDEYKASVVDTMLSQYARGITPNPDVLCNREIKFGRFAQWAFGEGAEYVATGHYARRAGDMLCRAVDAAKDQSYFLYRIEQSVLRRTLFPLGEMHKRDVRAAARRLGLPVSEKPDSQGLCFIGAVTMSEFLSRYVPLRRGPVLDMADKPVGEHDGAALYTIGQRHGFRTTGGEVRYVVDIDTKANTIRVSSDQVDAKRRSARITDAHWIGETPSFPLRALAQTRYHEAPVGVTLAADGLAAFDEPHTAAPGQSLVVYDGDRCLGGGMLTANSEQ
jgi:tRNA-specific 2-thiouridylase